MKDDYSGLTTDTLSKMINCYPDNLHHKVALCRHLTIPPYKHVRVTVVTKSFELIHTEPKKSFSIEHRVRSADGLYEAAANKPMEILSTSFYAV